jgi:hypothetical protein
VRVRERRIEGTASNNEGDGGKKKRKEETGHKMKAREG